jgi:hypothetical protein
MLCLRRATRRSWRHWPPRPARRRSLATPPGRLDLVIYNASGRARGAITELDPEAIADSYFHLHRQQRSAWVWEIELRPWVETF